MSQKPGNKGRASVTKPQSVTLEKNGKRKKIEMKEITVNFVTFRNKNVDAPNRRKQRANAIL